MADTNIGWADATWNPFVGCSPVSPACTNCYAQRELEQTVIMLETWAPEIFPEVNEYGQVHFGRAIMDSAAQAIRDAWASAIAEVVEADDANP
jgi:protein gp37